MARELTFYIDRATPDGRLWQRLMYIPPDSSSYTPLDPPEWGEAPGVGSTYVRFPILAVTGLEGGGTAYDALPIGLPVRAERKVTINLSRLLVDGDANLINAHGWITETTLPSVSLTTVPSAPTLTMGGQWILLQGAKGSLVADFDVAFHGVQMLDTDRPLAIRRGIEAAQTFTVVDIAEYVLRTIKVQWVAERHTDLVGVTTNPCYELWLRLWLTTHRSTSLVAKPQLNDIGSGRFQFSMIRWSNPIGNISGIGNEIFQRLTRQGYNSATSAYVLHNTPLASVQTHTQNYAADGLAGSALGENDTFFIGYVVDTEDGNAVVAGRYSDGDGSIFGYESVWEWLNVEAKTAMSHVVYRPSSPTVYDLWFLPPLSADTSYDIEATDIISIDECVGGKFALTTVTMDRDFYGEMDASKAEVLGSPHAAGKWGTTMGMEVGAVNDNADTWEPEFTHGRPSTYWPSLNATACISIVGLPPSMYDLIYYRENTSNLDAGGTADIYCAAHHKVHVYGGGGGTTYDVTPLDDLPTSTPITTPGLEGASRYLTYLRPLIVQAQQGACLGGAVAQHVMSLYGTANAYRLKITVPQSVVPQTAIGATIRLMPGVDDGLGGTIYNGRMLLDRSGDTTADIVPGIGEITEIAPNDIAGTVQITALMTRFS